MLNRLSRSPRKPTAPRGPMAVPKTGIISASGEYCLTANRTSVREYNIRVEADDVDLNLNGKILQNSSASGTLASYGVYVGSRTNVRVRNGRILGSQYGILANTANGLTVEDVDFSGCRYIGVSVSALAASMRVRRCTFARISGWTVEAYAIGVNGVGINGIVEHCTFREFYRQSGVDHGLAGEGCAILVSAGARDAMIRQNWFDNTELRGESDIAIWVAGRATATITRNTITNFGRGIICAGDAQVAENRLTMLEHEDRSYGIQVDGKGQATRNVLLGYWRSLSGTGTCISNYLL